MQKRTIQLSFFIAITFGLLVLSFFVFKPYLGIIFLSGVLSVIFHPLYQKFLLWFNGKKGLASMSTLVVIVVCILIPLAFIFNIVFSQAVDLYNSIAFGEGTDKMATISNLMSSKFGNSFLGNPSLGIDLQDYFRDVLSWVISHFDSIFTFIFKGIFGFFLMLLSIYYLLKNSSYIKQSIIMWSPLPDNYDEEVLEALKSSVDAIFKGRFLVSVAQGFFLTVGFLIFDIPNAVLWGFVGSIASLIPILGTSIITVPASIFMFITGDTVASVGIIIWGALAIGLIDDVLTFFILKGSMKVHPLVVLISIFGGIQFFGPIGFIAGPVLVSAFLSLMKIYPFIMFHKEKDFPV